MGIRLADTNSRPELEARPDNRNRPIRAAQYSTAASKWRDEKEKALKKLLKPFKYSKKKLEFDN